MKSCHFQLKLILRSTAACLLFLSTCHAMSSSEATFRCKVSIERAEDISSTLSNPDLKKVAKAAISTMKILLNDLSHDNASKDLPTKTYQCIQQAAHIAWLKETIEPAIQSVKIEKPLPQKTASEVETTKGKGKSATKKPKREQKTEEKKIDINQRDLDSKSLEKALKSETDSKSKASKLADLSSKTSAASL